MASELKTIINEISNYRASFYKNDFIVKVNDYQVLGTEKTDKYEIDILKNYNIIQKGTINKDDVVYFLLYFKEKTS